MVDQNVSRCLLFWPTLYYTCGSHDTAEHSCAAGLQRVTTEFHKQAGYSAKILPINLTAGLDEQITSQ